MSRIVSDLDPFSEAFKAEPYAHYALLRALGPVVWLERHGIWAVSHYDAVRDVLIDHETFSNAGGSGLVNYFVDPPWRKPSIVLEADPPEHTRTRSVLNRVLARPAVEGLRGAFALHANRLIDEALARETIDAIPDMVQPFPLTVFGDAVGLEREDRQNLLAYGAIVFGAFGPDTEWQRQRMADAEVLSAWIMARCQRETLAPQGFGASIYAFADSGDITLEEAALLVRSLLSAGVDTTIDSIGLALGCLVDHPDQWRLLRDDPSMARAAFDEATRYDSSSQSLIRTTLKAVDFAGADMARHDKVIVFLGSAGRDPAFYDAPDVFDIRRPTAGQMGFGVGIHGCVAQMLARLEGEVFFRALAEKVDDMQAAGPSALRPNSALRGLASLPVALGGKSQ